MTVSIIIPAYNEAAHIVDVIESVKTAALALDRECEIIVVNDSSTDATAALAEAAGARIVHVEHQQISKTRNSGARAATGDYFVFLDGDTVIAEQTLVRAVAALDEGAAGGGGHVLFDDDLPLTWRILLPPMRATMWLIRASPGCFMFCRRDAFDAVGGFDETIYASEEIWFSWGLGRQGRFVILDYPVITSGRKARMCSVWEVLGTLFRLTFNPWALKKRAGLELWYDGRREDETFVERIDSMHNDQ